MKIVLLGYGKMGKEIEKIAITRGHIICLKVDENNAETVTKEDLAKGDVAIEFSTPDTVLSNIKKCFEADLPIVIGTTGWYDNFNEITKECEEKKKSMFYASNFSLGVNLFFKVNKHLAELMNKYNEYDVSMEEIHHIHKLDKPSGTAITLAEQILDRVERKEKWSIEDKEANVLHINDIREGEVFGTHSINYSSEIDDIYIRHTAHNRKGFALGSVVAAEFLNGKKGVYNMENLI